MYKCMLEGLGLGLGRGDIADFVVCAVAVCFENSKPRVSFVIVIFFSCFVWDAPHIQREGEMDEGGGRITLVFSTWFCLMRPFV